MAKYLLPILLSAFLFTSCGGDSKTNNNTSENIGGPTDTPPDDPARPDPDEEAVTNEMANEEGMEAANGFVPSGTPDKEWGLGVIIPQYGDIPSEKFVWPDNFDLPVFDAPSGNKTGTLKAEEYGMKFNPVNGDPNDITHVMHVAYDANALVWYGTKDKWAIIRPGNDDKDHYIYLPDLLNKGYKAEPWDAFLLSQEGSLYERPEGGLNLRTAADATADKLVTMKGDRFLIYLTGGNKGAWLEARVEERSAHPCEGDDELIKEYRGWFKALDDSGFPNIYFYTDC